MRFIVFLCCSILCYGQFERNFHRPHADISDNIGNFSIELLYHYGQLQPNGQNLVMSPITVWTALAVVAEGATKTTKRELDVALRLTSNKTATRIEYRKIAQALLVDTESVELAKVIAVLVDVNRLPQLDFLDMKSYYKTDIMYLNFTNSVKSANLLNKVISDVSHRKMPKLIESSAFKDSQVLLASGLYFKGQWTLPFNPSATSNKPFYDSNGTQIGEVDMMHSINTYPYSAINALEARVIELPYGKEERLSMFIILPNQGISLETMITKIPNFPLSTVFRELRLSKDYEVDCNIPKFKIESDIDLSEALKRMGVYDLFDESHARLPYMARTPLYVSKVVHKVAIEVNEEGATADDDSEVEIPNRAGLVNFEANRPFMYIIVDNVVNCIILEGCFMHPSL